MQSDLKRVPFEEGPAGLDRHRSPSIARAEARTHRMIGQRNQEVGALTHELDRPPVQHRQVVLGGKVGVRGLPRPRAAMPQPALNESIRCPPPVVLSPPGRPLRIELVSSQDRIGERVNANGRLRAIELAAVGRATAAVGARAGIENRFDPRRCLWALDPIETKPHELCGGLAWRVEDERKAGLGWLYGGAQGELLLVRGCPRPVEERLRRAVIGRIRLPPTAVPARAGGRARAHHQVVWRRVHESTHPRASAANQQIDVGPRRGMALEPTFACLMVRRVRVVDPGRAVQPPSRPGTGRVVCEACSTAR